MTLCYIMSYCKKCSLLLNEEYGDLKYEDAYEVGQEEEEGFERLEQQGDFS